jgi:hypothetical protein
MPLHPPAPSGTRPAIRASPWPGNPQLFMYSELANLNCLGIIHIIICLQAAAFATELPNSSNSICFSILSKISNSGFLELFQSSPDRIFIEFAAVAASTCWILKTFAKINFNTSSKLNFYNGLGEAVWGKMIVMTVRSFQVFVTLVVDFHFFVPATYCSL